MQRCKIIRRRPSSSVGVSYLVEQPPHCDLLRLSLGPGDLYALDIRFHLLVQVGPSGLATGWVSFFHKNFLTFFPQKNGKVPRCKRRGSMSKNHETHPLHGAGSRFFHKNFSTFLSQKNGRVPQCKRRGTI